MASNLKEQFEQKIKDSAPKELPRGPGKVGWSDEFNQGQKKIHKPGNIRR